MPRPAPGQDDAARMALQRSHSHFFVETKIPVPKSHTLATTGIREFPRSVICACFPRPHLVSTRHGKGSEHGAQTFSTGNATRLLCVQTSLTNTHTHTRTHSQQAGAEAYAHIHFQMVVGNTHTPHTHHTHTHTHTHCLCKP